MKIGIIGLGYVGLPLLIEFSKKYNVIGFDKNTNRIQDLKNKKDINNELNTNQFKYLSKIKITDKDILLKECNIFIVTVPTPVKKNNKPDLQPLKLACLMISKYLKKNDIVIFESTVFPGLTEDFCVNWLNNKNKLVFNKDFFCGYSPERINPGDKSKTLTKIKKITSGSNMETANIVDRLYNSIIKAGTYKAQSIKIAEAAKIIENCQRDINIAFVNELENIFDNLDLDTKAILKAANTKWNFLNFKPGLVGGHCVSVDPYYLIEKSIKHKFTPSLLVTARKINENVPYKIYKKINKLLKGKKKKKILILGFAFKENCNDIRNTKIFDLFKILDRNYKKVDIFDPLVDKKEVKKYYNININKKIHKSYYDLVIIAVKHKLFKKYEKNIGKFLTGDKIIYDYINLFK